MGHYEGGCFVGRDVRISQYYRREWARIVGQADEWDYLLVEEPHRTKSTIELFLPQQG